MTSDLSLWASPCPGCTTPPATSWCPLWSTPSSTTCPSSLNWELSVLLAAQMRRITIRTIRTVPSLTWRWPQMISGEISQAKAIIIIIVDKHPNKCISGSTTGTWTSTSCGLTQSSTSLFPSSFWSSSTLSHSGLVVSLYFSLPITLCKRGLWFNLRFIYFLCIYYLQETHRALPKPPGKHRDDKRDQCEPAPRGKVTLPWLCRDYAVTLPWLCRDYAVTLPWLCRDFAVTMLWLCRDFAVTLPWRCRDSLVLVFCVQSQTWGETDYRQ